ncbi:MAG: peptidase S10, partial [Thermoanaerobaculia bacterium]|nr:peptidase S10 [Thermoanaerobaculia bacterium]
MPASAILPLLVLLAQPRAARPDAAAAAPTPEAAEPAETKKEDKKKEEKEVPPIVTRHEMRAGGRLLKYTATTGLMPLRSETGDLEAHVFYIAYTLDRGGAPLEKRPLMFSFNGGPGSSSVWLHLGALGPKRVKMQDDGAMPPPPYQLVANPDTWLDDTDLVFIDPVGTG